MTDKSEKKPQEKPLQESIKERRDRVAYDHADDIAKATVIRDTLPPPPPPKRDD